MNNKDNNLSRRRCMTNMVRGAVAGLAMLTMLPAVAADAAFPARPIEFWIPFPPGGGTDAAIRVLATIASRELGQQVVPVNKPGAGATLAASVMSQSAANDGHTVALVAANILRMPHLQKTPYDPLKDFTWIMGLTNYRYGIVVRADSKFKTLADLLAHAKANPGKVSYGAVGIGSSGHISMERLARSAGVSMNFVPYKGSDELVALLAGDIDAVLDPGWGPYVSTGKMRALAIVGDKRFPRFADVPTLRELGHDITASSQVGIVGPRNMDPKVVKVLHDAFRKASRDPLYIQALERIDLEEVYLSSEDYKKYAHEQYERERVTMQQLKIKLN